MSDLDEEIISAMKSANSALLSVAEQLIASDKVTIEIVTILVQRAVAEDRVDEVRPLVKALGATKEKSNSTLTAIREAIEKVERISNHGGSDAE